MPAGCRSGAGAGSTHGRHPNARARCRLPDASRGLPHPRRTASAASRRHAAGLGRCDPARRSGGVTKGDGTPRGGVSRTMPTPPSSPWSVTAGASGTDAAEPDAAERWAPWWHDVLHEAHARALVADWSGASSLLEGAVARCDGDTAAGPDALRAAALARANLAACRAMLADHEAAHAFLADAFHLVEAHVGDTHPALLPLLDSAARLACLRDDYAAAEPYLLRAHAIAVEHGLPTDAHTAWLALVAHAATAIGVAEPPRAHEEAMHEATTDVSTTHADGLDFDLELDDEALARLPSSVPGLTPTASGDVPPVNGEVEDARDLYGTARWATSAAPAPPPNPLGFTVEYGIPRDILLGEDDAA